MSRLSLATVALIVCSLQQSTLAAGWFEDATGIRTPEPIRVIAPNGIQFTHRPETGSTIPVMISPDPVSFWRTPNGSFQRTANGWVEYNNGRVIRFREISYRDGEAVIFDSNRNLSVKLTYTQAFFGYPKGNWNFLYNRVR